MPRPNNAGDTSWYLIIELINHQKLYIVVSTPEDSTVGVDPAGGA